MELNIYANINAAVACRYLYKKYLFIIKLQY